jgi:hypothetical protein
MLARLVAVRRVPRLLVVPVRYSSGEGSLAQSKDFGYVVDRHICLMSSWQLTGGRNGLKKVVLNVCMLHFL